MSPDAPAGFHSLAEALAALPYRSAIAPAWTGASCARNLPPILAAIALTPGVPFGGADLAAAVEGAATAHAAGGTFLLLAADPVQRDDAKRRIIAALTAAATRRGGVARSAAPQPRPAPQWRAQALSPAPAS